MAINTRKTENIPQECSRISYTVHQTTVFVTHINIASPIASKFKIVGDLKYIVAKDVLRTVETGT